MNLTPSVWRLLALMAGAGLALAGAGCQNPFVAKHRVLVDAIAAPGAPKPNGSSYRLVAKKTTVSGLAAQVSVVKACVDAALAGLGMFEAPPNGAPDIVIEIGYGQDSTPRVDPSARETYLQLSARSNPGRAVDGGTGQEIWDVRVALLGIAGRMESAMPLLAMVAANYIATDTKLETRIDIPQNSPSIEAVRQTAIKALEKPTDAPAAGAPAAGSATPVPATQSDPIPRAPR
jgi:hypothetical protein